VTHATATAERLRTFGAGNDQLAHPVDMLGRARFRATLDRSSVHVTRSADATAAIPFKGTAILFDKRTWIGSREYGFWEQIAPQAVTKTLQEADVRFLQNHNPDLLLARTNPKMRADGTQTLSLTSTLGGLVTEADMAPVSYAQDLAVLLDRGDISQMSFAFDPIEWLREDLPDGSLLITITSLRLYDVSVVTYPAYEETDAGLRAAAFDAMCRTNGFDPAAVARGYLVGGQMPSIPAAPAPVPPFESRSLKRGRLLTPSTRSLNGWTLSDLWSVLDQAIVEYCSTPDFNAYWYVWIVDVSDEWFVYNDDRPGATFPNYMQMPYTIDADGTVTLGTPVEVVMKTTYLPVKEDPVEDEPAMGDPPVEDTEFSSAPATATRTNSPPAETTGAGNNPELNPGDRMRELRAAELDHLERATR
jgi:HK97 family phage prohead protease